MGLPTVFKSLFHIKAAAKSQQIEDPSTTLNPSETPLSLAEEAPLSPSVHGHSPSPQTTGSPRARTYNTDEEDCFEIVISRQGSEKGWSSPFPGSPWSDHLSISDGDFIVKPCLPLRDTKPSAEEPKLGQDTESSNSQVIRPVQTSASSSSLMDEELVIKEVDVVTAITPKKEEHKDDVKTGPKPSNLQRSSSGRLFHPTASSQARTAGKAGEGRPLKGMQSAEGTPKKAAPRIGPSPSRPPSKARPRPSSPVTEASKPVSKPGGATKQTPSDGSVRQSPLENVNKLGNFARSTISRSAKEASTPKKEVRSKSPSTRATSSSSEGRRESKPVERAPARASPSRGRTETSRDFKDVPSFAKPTKSWSLQEAVAQKADVSRPSKGDVSRRGSADVSRSNSADVIRRASADFSRRGSSAEVSKPRRASAPGSAYQPSLRPTPKPSNTASKRERVETKFGTKKGPGLLAQIAAVKEEMGDVKEEVPVIVEEKSPSEEAAGSKAIAQAKPVEPEKTRKARSMARLLEDIREKEDSALLAKITRRVQKDLAAKKQSTRAMASNLVCLAADLAVDMVDSKRKVVSDVLMSAAESAVDESENRKEAVQEALEVVVLRAAEAAEGKGEAIGSLIDEIVKEAVEIADRKQTEAFLKALERAVAAKRAAELAEAGLADASEAEAADSAESADMSEDADVADAKLADAAARPAIPNRESGRQELPPGTSRGRDVTGGAKEKPTVIVDQDVTAVLVSQPSPVSILEFTSSESSSDGELNEEAKADLDDQENSPPKLPPLKTQGPKATLREVLAETASESSFFTGRGVETFLTGNYMSEAEAERAYIEEILLRSGLLTTPEPALLPQWQHLEGPLQKILYRELESDCDAWAQASGSPGRGSGEAWESQRRRRKVIFDATAWGVRKVLEPYMATPPWLRQKVSPLRKCPSGDKLIEAIWNEICRLPVISEEQPLGLMDEVVEYELSAPWEDLGLHEAEVKFEVGEDIFDELLADAIEAFVQVDAVRRRRRAKQASLKASC